MSKNSFYIPQFEVVNDWKKPDVLEYLSSDKKDGLQLRPAETITELVKKIRGDAQECTDVQLPSILMDPVFTGLRVLHGKEGGPARRDYVITGTRATVIWNDHNTCYEFSSEGNVQEGDICQFDKTLKNEKNFYIADVLTVKKYSAYKILITSLKVERFNEMLNDQVLFNTSCQFGIKKKSSRSGIRIKKIMKAKKLTLELKYDNLIVKAELEKCIISNDNAGMSTDTISGRLVHLDAKSNLTEVVVSNILIQAYQTKTRSNVRDFIISSHEHPMIAGFKGNLFEDYIHLELQRGGKFSVRFLNNNSDVGERDIM
ncbi:14604_t:CDS:2 [Gigaspora margarita]|uniref:14604_t:CDS:1 n=1 Tax=Gigaspora margarita TaxID=4874 RepID=A0ABN7VCQ0_GIGMA|nr:14604_t:CDS:2 [Gigaspora margarita]